MTDPDEGDGTGEMLSAEKEEMEDETIAAPGYEAAHGDNGIMRSAMTNKTATDAEMSPTIDAQAERAVIKK